MSRYSVNSRLGNLPTSPGDSPKGFCRVIKGITTKVAAHTDMSLGFVEFVAQSPIGWLPVLPLSPRISSDLLQKRSKSCEAFSPSRLSPEPYTRRELPRGTQCGSNTSREEGVARKQQSVPRIYQEHTRARQIWRLVAKLTFLAAVMVGFSGLGKTAATAVLIAFIVVAKFLNERFRERKRRLQPLLSLRSPLATTPKYAQTHPQPNEVEIKPGFEAIQRNDNPSPFNEGSSSRALRSDARKLLRKDLRHSFKSLSVQVPRAVGSMQADWESGSVHQFPRPTRERMKSPSIARVRSGRSNSEAAKANRAMSRGRYEGAWAAIAIVLALAGLLFGRVPSAIAVCCWLLLAS